MSTLPLIPRLFGLVESKPERKSLPIEDPARPRLMSQIITINPTATAAFLERFGTRDLEQYLRHLNASQQPRGRAARWVRPEGGRAIQCSEASA
jgi:hypothetical protein